MPTGLPTGLLDSRRRVASDKTFLLARDFSRVSLFPLPRLRSVSKSELYGNEEPRDLGLEFAHCLRRILLELAYSFILPAPPRHSE